MTSPLKMENNNIDNKATLEKGENARKRINVCRKSSKVKSTLASPARSVHRTEGRLEKVPNMRGTYKRGFTWLYFVSNLVQIHFNVTRMNTRTKNIMFPHLSRRGGEKFKVCLDSRKSSGGSRVRQGLGSFGGEYSTVNVIGLLIFRLNNAYLNKFIYTGIMFFNWGSRRRLYKFISQENNWKRLTILTILYIHVWLYLTSIIGISA